MIPRNFAIARAAKIINLLNFIFTNNPKEVYTIDSLLKMADVAEIVDNRGSLQNQLKKLWIQRVVTKVSVSIPGAPNIRYGYRLRTSNELPETKTIVNKDIIKEKDEGIPVDIKVSKSTGAIILKVKGVSISITITE